MNQLISTVSLLMVAIPGFLLARLILGEKKVFEAINISFLLGIQVVTLAFFIFGFFFKTPLTLASGWTIYLLVVLGLLFVQKNKPGFKFLQDLRLPAVLNWELLFVAFLVSLPGLNFLTSHWFPLTDWDAVTLFDFRARVLLYTGSIPESLSRASFISYPLLTSLAHWWQLVNGAVTSMPLYPVFYGFFLISLYGLFTRFLPRHLSLVFTLLLGLSAKTFDQSLVAYSNLPYSIYLILGAGYLYFWSKHKEPRDMLMGLTLSFASLWARSFPFVLANVFLVLMFARIANRVKIFLTVTTFIVGSVWLVPQFSLSRLLQVIDFFYWAVIKYYWPYWLLLALSLFAWYRSAKRNWFWPILITCYLGLALLGTYVYAGRDPNFAVIPDTIQRTLMFLPIAIGFFAASLDDET